MTFYSSYVGSDTTFSLLYIWRGNFVWETRNFPSSLTREGKLGIVMHTLQTEKSPWHPANFQCWMPWSNFIFKVSWPALPTTNFLKYPAMCVLRIGAVKVERVYIFVQWRFVYAWIYIVRVLYYPWYTSVTSACIRIHWMRNWKMVSLARARR